LNRRSRLDKTVLVAIDQTQQPKEKEGRREEREKVLRGVSFVAFPCFKEIPVLEMLMNNDYPIFITEASQIKKISERYLSKQLTKKEVTSILNEVIRELKKDSDISFHFVFMRRDALKNLEFVNDLLLMYELRDFLKKCVDKFTPETLLIMIDKNVHYLAATYRAIIDSLNYYDLDAEFSIRVCKAKGEKIYPIFMLADIVASHIGFLLKVRKKPTVERELGLEEHELQKIYVERPVPIKKKWGRKWTQYLGVRVGREKEDEELVNNIVNVIARHIRGKDVEAKCENLNKKHRLWVEFKLEHEWVDLKPEEKYRRFKESRPQAGIDKDFKRRICDEGEVASHKYWELVEKRYKVWKENTPCNSIDKKFEGKIQKCLRSWLKYPGDI